MNERSTIIQLDHVVKTFAGGVTAVDDVSLDIFAGEFFALLGPSGCGKTTLLRMLAGFEVPTSGDVIIAGENMADIPPNRRPVNMVFQSYAVFPHMSVFDNVGYGLKVSGVGRAEIKARVSEVLEQVALLGYEKRKPDQLSGGQRQRVALARALVKRPKVLLLDEPLSALDAKLREAMQLELVKLQHAVGITFVIVTHDQDEALSMADRIAVMDRGIVRQVAPPAELYEYPRSRFVADFIGKMNLFEGEIRSHNSNQVRVSVAGLGEISVPANGATNNAAVGVAIRPEKIKLYRQQPSDGGVIAYPAQISNVAYHGSENRVFLTTASGVDFTATIVNSSRQDARSSWQTNESIWLGWAAEDTLLLIE